MAASHAKIEAYRVAFGGVDIDGKVREEQRGCYSFYKRYLTN